MAIDSEIKVEAFLSLLERDLHTTVQEIDPEFLIRVRALVADVEVDIDAPLDPNDD